ncbi:MAG: hypothetical protein FMNOHCHN_00328 [Ignavibacteriaceae bacterium]|nr:hypothetical protein [Ignavibacteriaceae bacterium]
MKPEEIILRKLLTECRKHIKRLQFAEKKITNILPLNAVSVENLTEDQIALIDHYIFRFSKLQDTMGGKLFKAVLNYLGEETEDKSFIDIFNRLEQLKVISDIEKWSELRTIRNIVSHEYEDDYEAMADSLNRLFESKDSILSWFAAVEEYLSKRGFNG